MKHIKIDKKADDGGVVLMQSQPSNETRYIYNANLRSWCLSSSYS